MKIGNFSLPSMSQASEAIHHYIGPDLHVAQLSSNISGAIKDTLGIARKGAKPFLELARQAGEGTKALEALPHHLAAMQQIGFDSARIKAEMHLARMAGAAGSSAARSALAFMKPMSEEAQALLAKEKSMVHGYSELLRDYRGAAESQMGKFALASEKLLSSSSFGKKILENGKILASDRVGNMLTGIGGASAAWKTFQGSGAESGLGKLAHSALSGGMNMAFSKALSKNPVAGLFDTAVKYGGQAVGASKEEAESFTFGKWAEGTSNLYMNIGKSIWNHDSSPLDDLHKQNMSGKNGKILQGYAMMGEKLADAMDPIYGKIIDWTAAAPKGFTKSQSWWQSH